MKRIFAVAAVSASALAISAQASFADYELNILHFNDWHSRIESNNAFESTCSAKEEGEGKCIGGAARLVTAIAQERKKLEGQNVILLNAGDNFQGSLFYSTYKGTAEGEFLNLMKPDAMTLGNHEFDDSEDALVPFLKMVTFPVVSANVSPNAQSQVGDMVKPYVVLEIGGQKIGIVGAVTNDTPEISSPGPNITIEDDVAKITEAVKALQDQGIDKIIALTHVGYPRDKEAIARIPGVDVVVGGHSHSLLSNTDAKAEGPYPTMIDNPEGYKVPVTQAASYSKYLGAFKVVFDDNGVVKSAAGDPIYLDKSIEPDQAVLARVAEMAGPIEELKAQEVSETTEAIDGSRETCRTAECTMGNLVTDAMLDRVKDQGATIAITNGGGLRASIDPGVVTMGEVLAVLPFQNTLATFQLTGKDIVASLESGVSQIEEGAGRFPQVAGLRFALDKSVKPGEGRIQSVEVKDGDGWTAIDPDKLYTVATNNFTRNGGDGYKLFSTNGQNAYDYGPQLDQVLADYLKAHRPYTPRLDGRITEVAAAAAQPAEEAKPAEQAQPAEAAKPAEEAKPAEAVVETPDLPEAAADIANTPPAVDAAPAQPAGQAQPAEEAKPAEQAAAAKTYTVVAGDSLWAIAKAQLGDAAKWPAIADVNGLKKPYRLDIGQELALP